MRQILTNKGIGNEVSPTNHLNNALIVVGEYVYGSLY